MENSVQHGEDLLAARRHGCLDTIRVSTRRHSPCLLRAAWKEGWFMRKLDNKKSSCRIVLSSQQFRIPNKHGELRATRRSPPCSSASPPCRTEKTSVQHHAAPVERASTAGNSGWFRGTVKVVPFGDSLVIVGGSKAEIPLEKTITLSSLIAPKLVRSLYIFAHFKLEVCFPTDHSIVN
ncbi:unnamed protein product [Fraxinus pennsylvanica]|uniref:Uncharacterized protein n=1 Tax=Fraxinus pennsylvanica TaxID=56036 RepID=A0AAD1Z8I0_9LAMI|nr:unnamed protein product [Fraxinus pennsylvanica]